MRKALKSIIKIILLLLIIAIIIIVVDKQEKINNNTIDNNLNLNNNLILDNNLNLDNTVNKLIDDEIEENKNLAPNFELIDQYGEVKKLSEYKGKTVLINFWGTWCKYCVKELPDIEEIYKQYAENNEDIVLLSIVNMQKEEVKYEKDVTIEDVKKILEEKNITYTTLFDISGEVFKQYNVKIYPTTYIIDKNGEIYEKIVGGKPKQTLIDALLKRRK